MMWQTLYEAYAWFVAAFRDASEKLRAGDRAARFPPGSFPPALRAWMILAATGRPSNNQTS